MIEFYISLLEDFRELATADENDSSSYQYAEAVTAPKWMQYAVKRGKKIREEQPESNQCCTAVGLRRANQIENEETLSLSTIKRMRSFASRAGGTEKSGKNPWKTPESKNAQALLLWGVPYSADGLEKFLNWCDSKINKLENN